MYNIFECSPNVGMILLPKNSRIDSSFSSESRFSLVDISTSFGENLYVKVSLLRNRKFDLISQSGWITLHATISCEFDFLFARSWAAIALPGMYFSV